MSKFGIEITSRFKRSYDKLPKRVQEKTKKTIRFLKQGLEYPSIRVKKISGTDDIWEGRVTRFYRITFAINNGTIVLRNVGRHDETLRKP